MLHISKRYLCYPVERCRQRNNTKYGEIITYILETHAWVHSMLRVICMYSIWSNEVWVSFVTLVGLFIRFLHPKQFVRFTKSKTWLLDDFNRSMWKSLITYIFFFNPWRICIKLLGRHSCPYGGVYRQLQQWHFLCSANFNPKGFTTIKRSR